MLNETLNKIETILKSSAQLTVSERDQLQKLYAELRGELDQLSQTQAEHAESIAAFASVAAQESLRKNKNSELTHLSLQGLKTSIDDFEDSHPKLFTTIQAIINSLRGLGV